MALLTKDDHQPSKKTRGRRSGAAGATGGTGGTEPDGVPAGKPGRGAKAEKTSKAAKGGKRGGGLTLGKGRGEEKAAFEPLVPTLPSTNLLPPAVAQHAHGDRLQRRFAVATGAALAGVAAVWLLQAGAISGANAELETEQARTAQLAGEARALAPVKLFYATLDTNRATIQTTMSREVLLSDIVRRLYATAPASVSLETVDATLGSSAAAAATPGTAAATTAPVGTVDCPSPDPYADPTARAGCLTISGAASSRRDLGVWESRIARTELFADLFISDSQAQLEDGGGAITFTATLAVTDKAFADRYADPAFLEGTSR